MPRKPWGFGEHDSHMFLRYSYQLLTTCYSSRLFSRPSLRQVRSPTICCVWQQIRGFGSIFESRYIFRAANSASELLRFLSKVAAYKPTSLLSSFVRLRFSLNIELGTLADGLGCFPFGVGLDAQRLTPKVFLVAFGVCDL